MDKVTESECFRGTRIQGTKGELIGDMITFVRIYFRFMTPQTNY